MESTKDGYLQKDEKCKVWLSRDLNIYEIIESFLDVGFFYYFKWIHSLWKIWTAFSTDHFCLSNENILYGVSHRSPFWLPHRPDLSAGQAELTWRALVFELSAPQAVLSLCSSTPKTPSTSYCLSRNKPGQPIYFRSPQTHKTAHLINQCIPMLY